MVFSDISHHLGTLNLETSYHDHDHNNHQHGHQQEQQHGMDPAQNNNDNNNDDSHNHSSASTGGESPPPNSDAKSQEEDGQQPTVVPPEEAILELCERTKYQIIQENGQRRYGPPPDWHGTAPNRGCEVFIGKIPRDCFEDELVPIFEKSGRIYMFRLMMDFSGSNRGYGFCIYTNRDDTKRAVHMLDNFEIRKGKTLGVCLSVDNCRLFVGGIPKTKAKHEILAEMKKITEGVRDVIVYPSAADKGKNRGFAFVEYEHHKAAAMARRKLIPGRIQLWGHQIAVDWAEPEREVDEDIMSKVKILYVRNLMLTTSEEHIRELFTGAAGGAPDCVERVKKIRDYAFVHFRERGDALAAMEKLDDTEIDGSRVEVSLAKPADKSGENGRAKTGLLQQQMSATPLIPGQPKSAQQQGSAAAAVAAAAAAAAAMSAGQQQALLYSMLGGYPMEQVTVATHGLVQSGAVSPSMLMQSSQTGLSMRPDSPVRGSVYRGRMLRNAAGSRSAGARGNIPGYNMRDKKPFTEMMSRRNDPKIELLDDLCARNGLSAPSYHVLTHEVLDPTTGLKSNWFLGRVTLSNIAAGGPRQYSAFRFAQTTEEARVAAAESALLQLSQPAAVQPMAVLADPAQAFMSQNFAALPMTAAAAAFPPLALSQPQQPQPPLTPVSAAGLVEPYPTAAAAAAAAAAAPFLYPYGAAAVDPNAAAFFAAAAAAAAAANNPQQQQQQQQLQQLQQLQQQHQQQQHQQHQQQQQNLSHHHQHSASVSAAYGVSPAAAALTAMLSGSEIYAHYVN